MKTKEELATEITGEISNAKSAMKKSMYSNEESDATNRLAISNLYIALSNLVK